MKVSELCSMIDGKLLTDERTAENEIKSCYACDLLSRVMAMGDEGCAWITVQTHMNVVAVASLHDMSCIICPEGIDPEKASVCKASDEGIALVSTPLTAYHVCGILYRHGILATGE